MNVEVVLDFINIICNDDEKYLEVGYRFSKNYKIIFTPKEYKKIAFDNNVTFEFLNKYKEFIENIVDGNNSIYYFIISIYEMPVDKPSFIEIMRTDDKLCYFNFIKNYKDDKMVMTYGVKNTVFTEPIMSCSYNFLEISHFMPSVGNNNPVEKIWHFCSNIKY
jgi:hypothetical protein